MLTTFFSGKTGSTILCSLLILLEIPATSIAQKVSSPAPDVSQLKKQFGDKTSIVCLTSNIDYTFDYSQKSSNPLTAKEVKNEQMMSLKDNYDFVPRFFYNDYTDIGTIKMFDKKNRRTDAYIYDLPAESGSEFYSGERMKAFSMNFENTGDKGGYTGETYFGDLKYLDEVDFRDYHPVLQKTITISVPKWINVEVKEVNF